MNADVFTKEGKKSREVELPSKFFGVKKNADLVEQVVRSMMSSARSAIAHTKTRGEVRGGGKKPWKQKGTGRARHGSTRSPIWVGGGVAHGPRNDKNFFRKVNRKMRTAALVAVLSGKVKDKEIIFTEDFSLAGKTKEGIAMVHALSTGARASALRNKRENAAYVLLPVKNEMTERALRNIGNLSIGETRNLDVVSALKAKYLVFVDPEKTFSILEAKMGGKVSSESTDSAAPEKKKRTVKARKSAAK